MLAHYDPDKQFILQCDASPCGVGAVLCHHYKDSSDCPVVFASLSLSLAERNYAQLDKEALAIVFGVRHFHHYLLGRPFTIQPDHKPLQHLLSNKAISAMASARIQRWALTLSAYHYDIVFKLGSQNANADVLSCLPHTNNLDSGPPPHETVLLLKSLQLTPITAAQP